MASRENYFADIDDKFFVDPSNFQGHQYSQYKNYLMSVALTTPSEYYKLQTDVIEQLNVKIAKLIYKQQQKRLYNDCTFNLVQLMQSLFVIISSSIVINYCNFIF